MMSVDSDFARLIADGQDDPAITRDRQVAVLLLHARHTSQALHDNAHAMKDIRDCLKLVADAAEKLQAEMVENTKITATVRDALTAGRVATLFIKWIGGIALAVGAVYGAWSAIRIGASNGGIGPG